MDRFEIFVQIPDSAEQGVDPTHSVLESRRKLHVGGIVWVEHGVAEGAVEHDHAPVHQHHARHQVLADCRRQQEHVSMLTHASETHTIVNDASPLATLEQHCPTHITLAMTQLV